jgi:hypothetical protein
MKAKKRDGQIAIEFLLLMGVAFAVIIVFLIVAMSLFQNTTETKTYSSVDDLGKALQQEFLLAAQLEDGYTREINLPLTLNGLTYNITLGNYSGMDSYVSIAYKDKEVYYAIPLTTGNLVLGDNLLEKINGTLMITH